MNHTTLRKKLKMFLGWKEWTLAEMGEYMGITIDDVYNLERGYKFTKANATKIAALENEVRSEMAIIAEQELLEAMEGHQEAQDFLLYSEAEEYHFQQIAEEWAAKEQAEAYGQALFDARQQWRDGKYNDYLGLEEDGHLNILT